MHNKRISLPSVVLASALFASTPAFAQSARAARAPLPYAVVPNGFSDDVSVLDTRTHTEIARIPVGNRAQREVADPGSQRGRPDASSSPLCSALDAWRDRSEWGRVAAARPGVQGYRAKRTYLRPFFPDWSSTVSSKLTMLRCWGVSAPERVEICSIHQSTDSAKP